VKEVDFFGQSDEYVVSGSDDGLLFIWDKKTAKIVQVLKADDEVVNVAKVTL
jgi:WD40 repeat protein